MNATVRALCLAWGAVVALLAYPAGAQFLGDQRAILGGEGFYRPLGATASVTIAAPAYTRTVTASSYTLTGTSAGSGAVTWSASPSGSSGACTGTDTWSCVVTVTPDAVGEGVETITVTRGSATDTETLGFYVAGAHSVFLSQNVNGSYNSGLADLDAVTTWENVGTSALDVTQAGAAALKPTFKTACFGSSSPCVRFDGGDSLKAASDPDWTFLNNGTDFSAVFIAKTSAADPNTILVMMSTVASLATSGHRGFGMWYDDRAASSKNDSTGASISSGTVVNIDTISGNGDFTAQTWTIVENILDDDAAGATDFYSYDNNAAVAGALRAGAYSASQPVGALTIGDLTTTAAFRWNGDVADILIYQSALTDVQRGINQAVADWASGGSEITPDTSTWVFVGDSITAGFGGVTAWPTKLDVLAPAGVHLSNRAVSGATAAQTLTQWRNSAIGKMAKIFVLTGINDIAVGTTAVTTFSSMSPIYSEGTTASQVVAMPTLPFGNAGAWTAGKQTELLALETSILADGNVDLIVNWYDLMGQGGTPEDLAAIYDNGDGVHPNAAGTTFMADEVATALGL